MFLLSRDKYNKIVQDERKKKKEKIKDQVIVRDWNKAEDRLKKYKEINKELDK